MAFAWIATSLLAIVMIIVPVILSNMFSFGIHDVVNDVSKNSLIPGWGTLSSIVNNPDFSARTTGFISIIIVFIALAILSAIIYFVKGYIIKNSKSISIISELIILFFSAYAVFIMFTSDMYTSIWGIDSGFWFYFVAVILSFLLLIINIGITVFLLTDFEE